MVSGMEVTYTVTGNCGNTSSCTSEILLVQDPVLTNPNQFSSNGATTVVINWNLPNGQLQQSADLIHWCPMSGATNSPYFVTNGPAANFYRLQFDY